MRKIEGWENPNQTLTRTKEPVNVGNPNPNNKNNELYVFIVYFGYISCMFI